MKQGTQPDAEVNAKARVPEARARQERMPAAMRQARIVSSFEKHGFVSISALAEELGVSGMTIRRDVNLLESRGIFERTHGGAIAAQPAGRFAYDEVEPAFEQRMGRQSVEKSAIAVAAANFIKPGESVGLDVGTSILALANELVMREDLRVFTNNLRVGMLLADSRNAVYMLGGRIRIPEYSVIGPQAVENLKSHFLDTVFIGVSGIDASGLYDYSPEDTEVKRAFIANAERVVVLCDSSKFSRRALSRVSTFASVNTLVTDAPPPADIMAAANEAGTRIVVA